MKIKNHLHEDHELKEEAKANLIITLSLKKEKLFKGDIILMIKIQ